ncbi:hypothetical protein L3H37_10885 [Corynebacterium sp. MC-20]|uniref:hypothetical protein n=1 Tax=Corynebacterium parakroppenstedtii TaxID=2828363 RepID=UPI001F359023|nr:hypothetical protein [Corynebacterium parakroppenstedtii]MCF6821068.1 hypothetical protein [Corynebacterium parakroppenstedtii]
MKTEVFMSMTPGLGGASKLHSLPKSPEDAVTILLLDTPQNTPVGTPGSDIFSDEEGKVGGSSELIVVPSELVSGVVISGVVLLLTTHLLFSQFPSLHPQSKRPPHADPDIPLEHTPGSILKSLRPLLIQQEPSSQTSVLKHIWVEAQTTKASKTVKQSS